MPISHTAPQALDVQQKAHRGVGFMGLLAITAESFTQKTGKVESPTTGENTSKF